MLLAIAFLIAFTLYQIYRLAIRWSLGLLFLILIVFDIVIIVLIGIEYRLLKELQSRVLASSGTRLAWKTFLRDSEERRRE